jgi:hypothetical protein
MKRILIGALAALSLGVFGITGSAAAQHEEPGKMADGHTMPPPLYTAPWEVGNQMFFTHTAWHHAPRDYMAFRGHIHHPPGMHGHNGHMKNGHMMNGMDHGKMEKK